LVAAAVLSGSALAADRMPAACSGADLKPMPPMPAPPGMKTDEPMPTAMAKEGTLKSDMMMSAAQSAHCMDQQLQQDQKELETKPKQ
jgi:hypothetical protein